MLTKQCARPGCDGVISEKYPSQLKLRTYCCWRCAQWAATQGRRLGQDDAGLRRALQQIQRALGVDGPPPESLVRIVRRIRMRSYKAGWTVVARQLRRAVARGVIVRKFAATALPPGCRAGALTLGARRTSTDRRGADARPHFKETA